MNRTILSLKAIPNATPLEPVSQAPVFVSQLQGTLWRCARSLWEKALRQRAPRRLRLCESLPLGERRFVAVVEFERFRFLVGGTSASLVLLARLENIDQELGQVAAESGGRNNGAQS